MTMPTGRLSCILCLLAIWLASHCNAQTQAAALVRTADFQLLGGWAMDNSSFRYGAMAVRGMAGASDALTVISLPGGGLYHAVAYFDRVCPERCRLFDP